MSNIDKQAQYESKFSRLRERYDEASHGNAEQMRDILEVTLDALESAERQILRLEKLAEAESVGADKAAASGVEWMKRCLAKDKRIAELELKLEAAEKRIAELEALAFNPALLDVIAERQWQSSVEGWTPKHDDKHDNNELAFAASCYAFHSAAASWDFEDDGTPYDIHPAPKNWPWSPEWWKPTNPRRDLVKAVALILAEIERIDRAAAGKGEAS
ncbi:TPA: ead/Ea22-like family protein [Enterobacter roggenkampii]